MFYRIFPTLLGALGASLLLAAPGGAQKADVRPPPPGAPVATPAAPALPEGAEVAARGPVHEAYAEASDGQQAPSPVVPKGPPPDIEEVPPEERPEGDVQWLPGYWAWDDERADYLWVSGFWRAPPPGRQWVPGGWQQVEGGWQRVSGFWQEAGHEEVQYLPPPPPPPDNGPSTPAPTATSTYVPGSWVYREARYQWRPGFWTPSRTDWVWSPDHYRWTPAGYLFVRGFWDRPLHERGLLFAPAFFPRGLRGPYTPSHVVEPDSLLGALFVRPGRRHYYFGDYFEKRYERRYVPWVHYRPTRGSRDHHFDYYRHAYSGHEGWVSGLRGYYAARYSGEVRRPPRTLREQTRVLNDITVNKTVNNTVNKNLNITNVQNVSVLAPIRTVNNVRVTALAGLGRPRGTAAAPINHSVRIEKVGRDRLTEERKVVDHYRAVVAERSRHEARLLRSGAVPVRQTDKPARVKFNLPKAPARLGVLPAKAAPPPPQAPESEARPLPKAEAPRPPREATSAAPSQAETRSPARPGRPRQAAPPSRKGGGGPRR
jgi:hypothetical protein